jgi:hypothetical protein
MRSINLHLPSLAAGVAASALVLLSMSQGAPQISPPRVSYGPHPRDMIQIKEGMPYVVPAGTVFVLTGLGTAVLNDNLGIECHLKVNGQREVGAGMVVSGGNSGSASSVAPVPGGFTAQAGATIEGESVVLSGQNGRAWGYLSR